MKQDFDYKFLAHSDISIHGSYNHTPLKVIYLSAHRD